MADKPLAILAAAHHFSMQAAWTLERHLLDKLAAPDGTSRGPAFEQFTAYHLALAFKSRTKLSSVFEFFTAKSRKSNKLDDYAHLVAAHRNGGGQVIFEPVDITSQERVAYQLGSSRKSQEDTLKWLQNPKRSVFCIPAKGVGPDII